ncbi:Exopolyphosphatase-related protein [Candidatus Phytoplasma mali]|uniref:Exopolyphosphatase-related protein n=1 Tax=Phytoplasma mali (strain AT) TaxID=482235 RepID=B3R0I6_PHYMT|nr:bifunctional oligoribonuclease/PAP phosphatase NrnA [Candidatus Phytoplasma mali]CAP18350.1 Exopolyphosphatase-related protein [Candidatus Phytoplasma mali]
MDLIEKKIKYFNTIIIHGHKTPDGDCYGSQFGLKNIIKNTFPEKQVYVVGENNPDLSFIGIFDQIPDALYKDALVIIVDTGVKTLISDQRFSLGKEIIWIDHHIKNNIIDDKIHYWVDVSFSSCSEMIFILKEKLNMKLDFHGALAIYVGILTDSGNLKYDRVNSYTFNIVSKLLKYGLNIPEIEQKIHAESLNFLKYKGYIIENLIIDKGFCYANISLDILQKFNLSFREALSAVNLLENLKENYVWALLLEKENNEIKVTIRSRGPEIYNISKKFGGGGHLKACGVIFNSKNELFLFLEEIKKSVNVFINK